MLTHRSGKLPWLAFSSLANHLMLSTDVESLFSLSPFPTAPSPAATSTTACPSPAKTPGSSSFGLRVSSRRCSKSKRGKSSYRDSSHLLYFVFPPASPNVSAPQQTASSLTRCDPIYCTLSAHCSLVLFKLISIGFFFGPPASLVSKRRLDDEDEEADDDMGAESSSHQAASSSTSATEAVASEVCFSVACYSAVTCPEHEAEPISGTSFSCVGEWRKASETSGRLAGRQHCLHLPGPEQHLG